MEDHSEASRFSYLEVDDNQVPVPFEAPPVIVIPPKAEIAPPIPDTKLHVTSDDLVTLQKDNLEAGRMVFWALSGKVDYDRLCQLASEKGLDEGYLPKPKTVVAALAETCKDYVNRNTLVRLHPDGGWVFVDEAKTENRSLSYTVGVRVNLDANEQIVCSRDDNQAVSEDFQNQLQYQYDMHRQEVNVSVWLVRLMDQLDGVALRGRGGFYFVPKHQKATLLKVKNVLAECSNSVVHAIPAMESTDVAVAVIDSIKESCDTEFTVLANELASDSAEMNRRGVKTRLEKLEATKVKVRAYEGLFKTQLGDLVSRIDQLKAQLDKVASRWNMLEV